MSDQTICKPSPWSRRTNMALLSKLLTWLERMLTAANRHIANGVPTDKFSWTVFM